MDKLLMESDGIEAVKWAIDNDDYIVALKNEITQVASLKDKSYFEVERILDHNFLKLIKNRRIASPMLGSH
jgi:TatD DNase family protein